MIIRKAEKKDIESIAKIGIATWRDAYKEIISDDYLSSLSVEKRIAKFSEIFENPENFEEKFFVAEADDAIIGFAICGKIRENLQDIKGELYAIYVLPQFQKSGAGKALLACVNNFLKSQELWPMLVYVLKDNLKARKFYEKTGGKIVAEKIITIGNQELIEIGYGYE